MQIGTLSFQVVGKLLQQKSCEYFIASIDATLLTISDTYDVDYRRFGYLGGRLWFVVPLKAFWKSESFLNRIRKELDRLFVNWLIDIDIIIHEKGGIPNA